MRRYVATPLPTTPKWIPKGPMRQMMWTDQDYERVPNDAMQKEGGHQTKPCAPKTCSIKPESQIQIRKVGTSVECHRYPEAIPKTGVDHISRNKHHEVANHDQSMYQEKNIAVRVNNNWCLPLNPPKPKIERLDYRTPRNDTV